MDQLVDGAGRRRALASALLGRARAERSALRRALRRRAEPASRSTAGCCCCSRPTTAEPRLQISDGLKTQQVFGIDVEGWKPGEAGDLRRGRWAIRWRASRTSARHLHRAGAAAPLRDLPRADGHVVKLPMDRGEGQQWNRAPGNLYSTPRKVALDPGAARADRDRARPGRSRRSRTRRDTKYVKHERIQSERLTKFWGRPMYLGAHVLLPEGFDEHPAGALPAGHLPRPLPRTTSAASARSRPTRT